MIFGATFVNFPLEMYHHILNDSSLNNCHNKLLENDSFPVYVLMPVNEYLTIIPRARMGSESIAHEAEGRMGY